MTSHVPGHMPIDSVGCVFIRYDEVPAFLQRSAFFLGLSAEGNHSIPLNIPSKCFKADDTVRSVSELSQLLHTVIFWGLDVIPESVLDFCHDNGVNIWHAATVNLPDNGHLHGKLTSCFDGTESILPAVSFEHPEILQHWFNVHPPENLVEPTKPCTELASVGNLQLLMKLHENAYPWNEETCKEAARGGYLDCLVYLHEQQCPWDESACTAAAEYGHLNCLQYLYESGCPWYEDEICCDAADSGDLACLQFVHSRGGIVRDYVTRTKSIDCLRYALEHDCPVHEEILSGENLTKLSIEAVRLFQEHGVTWAEDICTASLECPVEYTKYFIEQGCQYESSIIYDAIWYGTPEHLEYLIDEVLLPMDAELYAAAFMNGCIGCVRILVDKGCPCTFKWYAEDNIDAPLVDERILPCIQYATERGWACSEDLIEFVFSNMLPLSQEYLRSEGWIESTRPTSSFGELHRAREIEIFAGQWKRPYHSRKDIDDDFDLYY